MKRRLLNTIAILCAVPLTISLLILLVAPFLDPAENHVSFGRTFHVSAECRKFDSRIVFFNDSEYGPYCGSVIGLSDDDGNVYPPLERQLGFGNTWGIYYRYFRWSDATLWTLTVSLWYPIVVLSAIVIGIKWRAARNDTRQPPETSESVPH
jgi:hypothetical protein